MQVEIKLTESIAEIVLNRPDKLNAMGDMMVGDIYSHLETAEAAGVRAVIFRAEGRAFSAGRDLEGVDAAKDNAEKVLGMFNRLISRVANFPAPTFAAVQGACLGAGLGVALACDVVYVANDAKLGSPFAKIGAVLDSGAHSHFVQRLGTHRALELIYTGELISGKEAAAIGLVNRSFDSAELLEKVRSVARSVANGPTAAFLESKRIIRKIENEGIGLGEVMALEVRAQTAASRTADYREGFSAFQQKRLPKFAGK
ncbi:MAG TPA: enoyl-CoA hydratase-related protein [Candidatus Binataceae bacterium]|jgi:enoyl-CoA hydratase/carnithine racemase